VQPWLIAPVLKPLGVFTARRIKLAIYSAIALGLLASFSPVLPLSFAFTSIAYLGPALVWALNGLPVAAAAIPLVGPALAPILSAAMGALAHQLILGPFLQTAILFFMLAFQDAYGRELDQIWLKNHARITLSQRQNVGRINGRPKLVRRWESVMRAWFLSQIWSSSRPYASWKASIKHKIAVCRNGPKIS
jgi:hypothetical protein